MKFFNVGGNKREFIAESAIVKITVREKVNRSREVDGKKEPIDYKTVVCVTPITGNEFDVDEKLDPDAFRAFLSLLPPGVRRRLRESGRK